MGDVKHLGIGGERYGPSPYTSSLQSPTQVDTILHNLLNTSCVQSQGNLRVT